MIQFELKNPLTVEERVQVTRLLGHDSNSNLAVLLNLPYTGKMEYPEFAALVQHSARIENTVALLTQEPKFTQWDSCDSKKLRYLIDSLSFVHERHGAISFSSSTFNQFSSEDSILYAVLNNLVKNALVAQKGTVDNGKPVDVSAVPSDFPEGATFIPNGAREFKKFVALAVHNCGNSFPAETRLEDYFTRGPPEPHKSGFGLYFTKLAAKFLRAPVHITSEPGNTTVSFYHPIYV